MVRISAASLAWTTDDAMCIITAGGRLLVLSGTTQEDIDAHIEAGRLVQDVGSVRIVANTGLYLVQRVPEILATLAGDAGVRRLVDAYGEYQRRSVQAYRLADDARAVGGRLARAATVCLSPDHQEALLRLSTFFERAERYNEYLNTIRLLNTIRTFEFGFATTAANLGDPSQFIELATQLKLFDLAMRLCRLFDSPASAVAEQWAAEMFVRYGDPSLFTVLRQLETVPDVDFEHLAQIGFDRHFRSDRLQELVAKIRIPRRRVMFQVKIHGCDPLAAALELRDGEAIVAALMHMKIAGRSPAVLGTHQDAMYTYALWHKYSNVRGLRQLPGDFAAELLLLHGGGEFCNNELLREAAAIAGAPFRAAIDVQQNVNSIASRLGMAAGCVMSARELVVECVKKGELDVAKQVAHDYGISARHFAKVMAQTRAKAGMWQELDAMSRAQSPLALDEFAELCFVHGNRELALAILERMPVEKRIAALEAAGMVQEAEQLRQARAGRSRPPS
jgi:hypothetical protein